MRTLSRLFLLVSLVASVWLQFYEPATRATPQLGYGCNSFATDPTTCASGCSTVEAQMFSNGEGATRLDTVFVECPAEPCVGSITRAVPNPACCDRDNDSYRGTRPGCGPGSDCNDDNPSVNPGAAENCSDGIDNNCNGQTDCNDSSCLETCCDADDDGYWSTSCFGDDCDDNDSSVHPGATEICENGKDDDCQGGDAACCPFLPTCDPPDQASFELCCCINSYGQCTSSPILIDVLGNRFAMTDAAGGVNFDLDGNTIRERLSWTASDSDDAWLVLDRNGNGVIDNGAEMFGNFTPQPQPPPAEQKHGFFALAVYDQPVSGGNGDGIVDRHDAIFLSLRLWQDINHNGISEPSELFRLRDLGLKSIDLDYKESRRTDEYGNRFRYRAKVRDTRNGQLGRWAWDVFLVRAP